MSTDSFGFTVKREGDGYKVQLPHQCDEWRIDEANAYEEPTDRNTALARLDAFIAEALRAAKRWPASRSIRTRG
jgi:hypothetical protein